MNVPEANLFTDGAAYERLMGRWSQVVGVKFLDWLGAPKGLRWIDVGCGNGAFTEVLIARAAPAAVTGIDPSPDQIDYAQKRPATKLAQFRVGGAQALPFDDNSFDAASMALVITFVPDPLKAAAEMARVVKPGGSVATYMWDIPAGGIPSEPISAAMKSLGIDGSQSAGRRGVAPGKHGCGMAQGRTAIGRDRSDPHCGRLSEFRRLRGFHDATGRAARQSASARCRQTSANNSRRGCASRCPVAADGSIAYDAFANAVQGRVPANR